MPDRTMSDTAVIPDVIPRDDRAWPRWAGPFSAAIVLGMIGAGVVLLAGAPDTPSRALTATGFVAEFVLILVLYTAGIRRFVAGHPFPRDLQSMMLAGTGLSAAVLYLYDARVGGAMLAGVLGGMFVANIVMIRAARKNRARVDEIEALLERERELVGAPGTAEPVTAEPTSDLSVGRLLRLKVANDRRRLLAWFVAAGLAITTCLLLGRDAATFGAAWMGAVFVLWALRRLWGGWLALRDFEAAETPPRRAYVVMLPPPPRMSRPLLGVWSQPPLASDGHMPPPEQVYLCDDDHEELTCSPEFVVPYEAWVDTGPRKSSKPRWVVADGGIALPHRKGLLARLHMGVIRAQRPEGFVPLTLPQPQPDPSDATGADRGRSWPVLVGGRLAGLALIALLFEWQA